MKDLAILASEEQHERLVILLADVAETVRGARAAGAEMPVTCAISCTGRRYVRFGPRLHCCDCGHAVLAADHWHRLLTAALREHRSCYRVGADERKAA